MLIKDFIDGQDIDQVLLLRTLETRRKRDGADYLRLTLGDRSGQVTAMVWDGVAEARELLVKGEPIRIAGRYEVHPRYGGQLALRAIQPAVPGTFETSDLLDGPHHDVDQMEGDLRHLIGTIQNPHLRGLLDAVFAGGTWRAYRDAPAAKHYHQAYRHGLLEHSLGVAQAVSAISATFPGIDRDVAVTGALLHDIGKLDAYEFDGAAIDLSDAGRLQGEIAMGYYRVRRLIESIDAFPAGLAQAVLHIILAHHGSLEHGSPVVPATREATLVHMVDNLGGRLGSFDRLEKELADGQAWSTFDRAIGGSAFFGRELAGEEELEAA